MFKQITLRQRSNWTSALLMVLPFMALYILFFLYPTFRLINLSFYEAPLIGGEPTFVGLENYRRLFDDFFFFKSVRNTFYFVLLSVIPNTLVGLMFAVMVVRLRRFKAPVLAAFFLPYMLPVSVVTLIWQWLLNTRFGVVQDFIQAFGGDPISFFSSPTWGMPAVAFITVWWTVGFNMLLFIAGLQGINKEYYEAASLDGANGLQIFRHITWPLLWPITALVLTLQLILQLRIFDQVYLLTGGGPFNSTLVTLQYVYRVAFQSFDGGYSATIAVALFIIVLIASFGQIWVLRTSRRS